METVMNTQYSDFFEDIRDGVELCRLINVIKPGAINEKKFRKSKIVFVSRTNIQIFTEACKKLGIQETDCFETRDLWDQQDLNAVIQNLKVLKKLSSKYETKQIWKRTEPKNLYGKMRLEQKQTNETISDLTNAIDFATKITKKLQKDKARLEIDVLKKTEQIQTLTNGNEEVSSLYGSLIENYRLLQNKRNELEREMNTLKRNNDDNQNQLQRGTQLIETLRNENNTITQSKNTIQNAFKLEKEQLMQEMDRLRQEMENMDDEKCEEEACKLKFKNWLFNTVKLKQYLPQFQDNECNDVRMIEFLDAETIKNDIGIVNKLHCKLMLKKANEYKQLQAEFNLILDNNKQLKRYKQIFEEKGILTLSNLQNDVATKQELGTMLNIADANKVNSIWEVIHPDDVQNIAKKHNEGQITEYH